MTRRVAEERSGGVPIVIDVSVSAAWCFEDETSDLSEAALDHVAGSAALVPRLWTFEMANVLALAARRGRIDAKRVERFLSVLSAMPVRFDDVDPQRLARDLVAIARVHELTAYDAAYLELSLRSGAMLATQDGQLANAAERAGVTLFGA